MLNAIGLSVEMLRERWMAAMERNALRLQLAGLRPSSLNASGLIVVGPSRRGRCRPRPSLTPPCGTTAAGSSGTTHEACQACVIRGRNRG